ncbi:MAG: cobyric acid synthase [Clostridium sp.]|nr:cobyric acid synthase [Acetatifactor muris]MCM1528033.1 cobyric acid synthase [Bacteroides sp.]MCM1563078.1 cobyric acid synthase [Clostridium sp.]
MAKVIMVQGSMSGAGKSLLVAGLCRIMRRDGYRVAPFKSQNMALNSFVTGEGLEMGRAQVMQAEAAGIPPLVCMNPILLKPTDHIGSQVIVNGRILGNMGAREYFAYKRRLIPDIKRAFRQLEEMADIIVIEGAGSPAEINLRENDIVNMGLAGMVDAPVLLVGDIDRGGVFAQLLGTLMLLEEDERSRVKGLIINKFRGDRSLLDSGIEILEQKGGIPVMGVVPYMELKLEDEDSLTERFGQRAEDRPGTAAKIDLAVVRYPRISNFTDFNVFEQIPDVSVRYVSSAEELRSPDMVFLPGSKNTMDDLRWMRENGLEAAVRALADRIPVCGICGGYQMLGERISDPGGVEAGGTVRGMGLLSVTTVLGDEKVCRRTRGRVNRMEGFFSALSGMEFEGYELHMGRNVTDPGVVCVTGDNPNVCGTYIHGIFDRAGVATALVEALARRKGIPVDTGSCMDYMQFKEQQYDRLADTLSDHLNMEDIYGILREAHID